MRYLLILLYLCCFACAPYQHAASYQDEQWLLNRPWLTANWLCDDCGELPENYQQQIKNHFQHVLIDPMSAMYEFNGSEPYAYYFSRHVDSQKLDGIGAFVLVNAKNRMGGYTGRCSYIAFFHEGMLRYVASYLSDTGRTYDLMTAQPY